MVSDKLLKKTISAQGEVLLYQTEDGATRIEVRMEGETVWMTQGTMAELYQNHAAKYHASFKSHL